MCIHKTYNLITKPSSGLGHVNQMRTRDFLGWETLKFTLSQAQKAPC